MHTLLRSPLPKIRFKSLPRIALSLVVVATLLSTGSPPATAAVGTTAWQNGTFVVDTPNLVRRSDIVLRRANPAPADSLPLGNGALGAAVWSADGFTAQLNRTDTFPDRKSLGQRGDPRPVEDDLRGRLHRPPRPVRRNAPAIRRWDDPDRLRPRRHPATRRRRHRRRPEQPPRPPRSNSGPAVHRPARASGAVAALAETWVDNNGAGASGRTFGSLAGLTAGGRNVVASTPNNLTGQVSLPAERRRLVPDRRRGADLDRWRLDRHHQQPC